jgi:mono/diheme cytochrome c family protein
MKRPCAAGLLAALPLAAALSSACLPEAPEKPTWVDDVWPILRTNCVRCHGPEPIYGAPTYFRLDSYGSAAASAALIGARAGTMGEMPPGGPELNAYQRQVLENWAAQANSSNPSDPVFPAKLDEAKPRANTLPAITASLSTSGETLTVDYTITDAEHDPIAAGLFFASPGERIARLSGGRGRQVVDLAQFRPGTYTASVFLSDGIGSTTVEIGSVVVAHANTSPFIRISSGLVITDADPAPTACAGPRCLAVELYACRPTDPLGAGVPVCDAADEAESYTATLVAERPGQKVTLAKDVALLRNTPPIVPIDGQVAWDPAPLAAGRWTLRVTVSDGAKTTESTAPVVIGHGTSTRVWAGDLEQVVGKHCLPCHNTDRAAVPPGVFVGDFAFGNRDDLVALRDYVYEFTITQRAMPPPSAKSLVNVDQPSEADRKAIGDWLLGGAP